MTVIFGYFGKKMLEMTTCFGPAPYSQQYLCENKRDIGIDFIKLMLFAYLIVTNGLLFIEKLQFEIIIF